MNPTRSRRSRSALAASVVACTALLAVGCSTGASGTDPQAVDAAGTTAVSPAAQTSKMFTYQGAVVQTFSVPAGVTSLFISAIGGSGGRPESHAFPPAGAAVVSGNLAVQPGQQLLISVAGEGADAGSDDDDALGGWGGLGAVGGNGDSEKDHLRSSGAGGGATTIQLTDVNGNNPQIILVAGGAGGAGAGSGDPLGLGDGGSAGCNDQAQPSWTGQNGSNGSSLMGGKGGTAAAASGMAGEPGKGGSGLGGNGGGGGGGVNGGLAGTGASGTQAGGGGGAGSSVNANMTATTVSCTEDAGNGVVNLSTN